MFKNKRGDTSSSSYCYCDAVPFHFWHYWDSRGDNGPPCLLSTLGKGIGWARKIMNSDEKITLLAI